MDYGLINAFLASEQLDEEDTVLRQNVLSLNEALQKLQTERADAVQALQRKEQDLLKVSGALENQLSIVEHIARRRGLEPLVTDQQQDEAAVQE